MGGYGSTRWGWHSKKTTVEECTAFSTKSLVRYVGLGPNVRRPWGGLAWRNTRTGEETSSIGVEIETSDTQGWARLHYSFTAGRNKGEKMDYRVSLVTTRPYFGGVRWWFICPLTVNGRYCGRRVGKLYLPPGGRYFGCRPCYDLTYESQREDRPGRLLVKAQKIRQRLGGSASMIEPFPDKPKGMHWDTYFRLWKLANDAEREYVLALGGWLDRAWARLGQVVPEVDAT